MPPPLPTAACDPVIQHRRGCVNRRRANLGVLTWLLVGTGGAACNAGLLQPASAVARPRAVERGVVAPAAAYGFPEMHAAWLTGSYWRGRPWQTGWYRAAPARWSVAGLAPPTTIVTAVNSVLAQGMVVIAVPGTSLWLNVASVEALPNGRISFQYSSGAAFSRGIGECQVGQLDARPGVGMELPLLHAACVVAFGRGV